MIYSFPSLPKNLSPGYDVTKAFNNFSTPPEISVKLQRIAQLREQFWSIVAQMEQKPAQQMTAEIDWMPMYEYINSGPDFLEIAVKYGNFPLNFKHSSILNPQIPIQIDNGKILIDIENEIAVSIEMILSRYAYCLTILKSVSGHVHQLRQHLANKGKEQGLAIIAQIRERLQNTCVRAYRIAALEAPLLQGLKGKAGPPEFFPGFANVMKRYAIFHLSDSSRQTMSPYSLRGFCWKRSRQNLSTSSCVCA